MTKEEQAKAETWNRASAFYKKCYCFGAGRGAVVAGRAAAGRAADGAVGGGAATPDEALYAVTTAWVTSVVGSAHMTLLC